MAYSQQSTKNEEILKEAIRQLKYEVDKDSSNREEAMDDLFFALGIGQWTEEERHDRQTAGLNTLQVNLLPKYVNQVIGELRQNKIKIKVRPTDTTADSEIAKIREGLIYNIEYDSSSENIYDYAASMMVRGGYGAWRVLTRYTETNPFQQEIYLELIENPFTVYMDTSAKDKNYADAKYGFIIDKMSKVDFEAEYPEYKNAGANSEGTLPMVGVGLHSDVNEEAVSIIEYFYKCKEKEKMVLLSDDRVMTKKQAEEDIKKWNETYDQAEGEEVNREEIPTIVKEREVTNDKVKWCKFTSSGQLLEESDWPGKYIPIVLIHGEETNVGGKRYINGLVRNSKDAVRLYNYLHTTASEVVAMIPKAPFMASHKMIEGYENDYMNAHRRNYPVLLYKQDSDFPGRTPERTSIGQVPIALFSEITRAEQNIKSTMGMFNADVGDQGRELSGTAIRERQRPGDTGTYIYPDNLAKGVMHCGRIINDLIPKIYVEERDARLKNSDDTDTFAPINTTLGKASEKIGQNPMRYQGMDKDKIAKAMQEGSPDETFNDITEGEYDVVIDVGLPYATQRQEASDMMVKIAAASSTMTPLDKYYLLKNMDFSGANEWADSIRKTLPPGVIPPQEGDQPQKPPPPSPQEQFAMQMQQAEKQIKMLEYQVQIKKMETEKERRQTEQIQQIKETIKAYTAKEELDAKGAEYMSKMLEMQLKQFEQTQIREDTQRQAQSGQ